MATKRLPIGSKIKILITGTDNGSCWEAGDIVYIREYGDGGDECSYGCSKNNAGKMEPEGYIEHDPNGSWQLIKKADEPKKVAIPTPMFNNELFKRFIEAAKSCDAVMIEHEGVKSAYGSSDIILVPDFTSGEDTEAVMEVDHFQVTFSSFFSHRLAGLKVSKGNTFHLMVNDMDAGDPPMEITFFKK